MVQHMLSRTDIFTILNVGVHIHPLTAREKSNIRQKLILLKKFNSLPKSRNMEILFFEKSPSYASEE